MPKYVTHRLEIKPVAKSITFFILKKMEILTRKHKSVKLSLILPQEDSPDYIDGMFCLEQCYKKLYIYFIH